MLEFPRRKALAQTLFRFSEIGFGAAVVSVWIGPAPLIAKIALGIAVMVLLVSAILVFPPAETGEPAHG